MPRLSLGLGAQSQRKVGGSPIPKSGLSLWLKADAGVTVSSSTSVTAWADQSGNNNNFSGSAIFQENSIVIEKPAIYFNGTDSYLDSPSTLLNNFSQISLFGVWYILPEQNNKGIFGTSNYSNLEIVASPGVAVRIRNNDYSSYFISDGFSNVDEWTVSYLDAQNLSGVAYKNGSELTSSYISQLSLTGAGNATSNGTYTRSSGGFTSFNGPNGNYIFYDSDWYVFDTTIGYETYYNPGPELVSWDILSGDSPAPTQTILSYGTSIVANSSAVEMPLANNVTYSLGRYAHPSFSGLNAEMYVAEFIIYNRRLTTPERQRVEAYLNAKYAIY